MNIRSKLFGGLFCLKQRDYYGYHVTSSDIMRAAATTLTFTFSLACRENLNVD